MTLTLSTPALLFGAISLLLLAFTNRFLAIAALIRALHDRYRDAHDDTARQQIDQLRRRLYLIRNMQMLATASFLLCVLCMAVLFFGFMRAGEVTFGVSLVLLLLALALSVREIQISVGALNLQLADLEDDAPARMPRATAEVPAPAP